VSAPLGREPFIAELRARGAARYHDRHPFHLRMHAGALSKRQIQGWVINRYYYQTRIPIKDALLIAKSEDAAFRRTWIRRIHDHDGSLDAGGEDGGLAQWLRLAEGVGLARDEVASLRAVLPPVRFACDAYVQLVRERSLVEAVASSLTEFFAPDLMTERLAAWEKHYSWIDPAVLDYFRSRPPRARRDSAEALELVVAGAAGSRALQERCIAALVDKCEILWALLDAVDAAHPDGAG
jgi:pyrroloquinoline-quinone synthase